MQEIDLCFQHSQHVHHVPVFASYSGPGFFVLNAMFFGFITLIILGLVLGSIKSHVDKKRGSTMSSLPPVTRSSVQSPEVSKIPSNALSQENALNIANQKIKSLETENAGLNKQILGIKKERDHAVQRLEMQAKYCPACGNKLPVPEIASSEQPTSEKEVRPRSGIVNQPVEFGQQEELAVREAREKLLVLKEKALRLEASFNESRDSIEKLKIDAKASKSYRNITDLKSKSKGIVENIDRKYAGIKKLKETAERTVQRLADNIGGIEHLKPAVEKVFRVYADIEKLESDIEKIKKKIDTGTGPFFDALLFSGVSREF
ncbi:MAG TPA: hypothetical protein VKM55_11760 [Candidatus Lokiarchaeia archaeon]|nr:hypothetical protein [Candidatus Lokiarchaeia archaeon]